MIHAQFARRSIPEGAASRDNRPLCPFLALLLARTDEVNGTPRLPPHAPQLRRSGGAAPAAAALRGVHMEITEQTVGHGDD